MIADDVRVKKQNKGKKRELWADTNSMTEELFFFPFAFIRILFGLPSRPPKGQAL